MVLDVVVGATGQVPGYLRPTIAVNRMILQDLDVLCSSPLHLLDTGIQMVVPPERNWNEKWSVRLHLMLSVYASDEGLK